MYRVWSRAKINLALRVVARRSDGFHELETVFQEIDLADRLSWQPGAAPLHLEISGADLEAGPNNLVTRAVHVFAQASGQAIGGLISLAKAVPMGGGLGGGSANAASILALLNRHFDFPLSENSLATLALDLGSDVPFFLRGGCCLGRGRGERLQSFHMDVPATSGLLLLPPFGLSTGAVFSAWSQLGSSSTEQKALILGRNDLLQPALEVSPSFRSLWQSLQTLFVPDPLFMTGSGSTLVYLNGQRPLTSRQSDFLREHQIQVRPFSFYRREAGV